jgi:hypothetical protein
LPAQQLDRLVVGRTIEDTIAEDCVHYLRIGLHQRFPGGADILRRGAQSAQGLLLRIDEGEAGGHDRHHAEHQHDDTGGERRGGRPGSSQAPVISPGSPRSHVGRVPELRRMAS